MNKLRAGSNSRPAALIAQLVGAHELGVAHNHCAKCRRNRSRLAETFAVENKYLDANRRGRFQGGDGIALALQRFVVGVLESFTVEEKNYGESMRAAIVEEIQRRGDALAHSLAAISYGPLLLDNFNALEQPRARFAERPRRPGAAMKEEGLVSARDQSARLEQALADNATLRRHASSVVHDFNNMLTVITGSTEMMLNRLGADDPLRRDAEAIKRATEWGSTLAQQILSGSRRPAPAPVPVDLNQLVGNVTQVLQPLLGDAIELVTRLSPCMARVSANPHQIGQVIMNLVINARDAMPDGGRLTIETGNVGQTVMLAVGDTGCGMDDETRARLFEPYFTTKEPGRRGGLGLATVYDVVTQCGGQISVSSDAGAGSTFKLYLPRMAAIATAAHTSTPPLLPTAGADGKTT